MLIDIIVSNIQEFIDTLKGDGTIVENFGIRIILLQPGEDRMPKFSTIVPSPVNLT